MLEDSAFDPFMGDVPGEMPEDPFTSDGNDPSSLLGGPLPVEVLSGEERRDVENDLQDLLMFEHVLAPMGIRGLAMPCEDCDEEHFHEWSMLKANLRQLLADGTMLPHEPAPNPNPNQYVTWDYCRGYVDAVVHGTANPFGFREHR